MPSYHAYPLLGQRSRNLLNQLHQTDWSQVKTLTIQNCDPDNCRFERCPLHSKSRSANVLPIRDQVEKTGSGVLVLDCHQSYFVALALSQFAKQLKKRSKHAKEKERI